MINILYILYILLYIYIKYSSAPKIYDDKINQFSSPVKHGTQINYKPVNSTFLRQLALSFFDNENNLIFYARNKGVHRNLSTSFKKGSYYDNILFKHYA